VQFIEFIQRAGQSRLIPHVTDQDCQGSAISCERAGDDHATQLIRQTVVDVTNHANPISRWFIEFQIFFELFVWQGAILFERLL